MTSAPTITLPPARVAQALRDDLVTVRYPVMREVTLPAWQVPEFMAQKEKEMTNG